MKTRKRILSFLLAVCLTLTAAIPAVFALEGEDGVLTYEFGFNSDVLSGKVEKTNKTNPYAGDALTNPGTVLVDGNGYFLNMSAGKRGFNVGTDYMQARFGSGYDVGHWFAIRIDNVEQDTYSMSFKYNKSAACGVVEIYVLSGNDYDDAVGATNFNTLTSAANGVNLSTEANEGIYNNLKAKALNANNIGKIDGYTSGADISNETYDMGNVTFPNVGTSVGNYVLIFRCANSSDSNTGTAAYQFALRSLTMTPVEEAKNVAQVGDDKFTDLQSAIAAAADAKSTVKLLDDLTVDSVSVSANATLDLNGHTLTATTVTTNKDSHIVDSSEGDTGLLVMTNNAIFSTNKELPLKDGDGYRFFDVTVTSLGITGTEQNKFWFRVSFTNSDAYALAASQMDIGADLSATQITTVTEAWAGTAFTAKWNTAVANSQPSDICFTAMNFSSLTNFKLTPMVKANGVTVSGAAL